MSRRLPIILGMLGCGVIAVAALWGVMDSRLAAVPKIAAWLGFFVGGSAALLLFIVGLMRNTREAKAVQQHRVAAPQPVFFPMAPDPSSARDAAELLRVPPETRDATWEQRFYGTVAAAALVPADPAQFTGPDRMPYAAFRLDETGGNPAQLSLTVAAETLTERGLGAVLNPRPDRTADWVFSGGDMLSLRLFGRIISDPAVDNAAAELATEREVLAGSPSETLLPTYTRSVIRKFMQEMLGISKPAVFLISDAAMQPPESLVFNVSARSSPKAGRSTRHCGICIGFCRVTTARSACRQIRRSRNISSHCERRTSCGRRNTLSELRAPTRSMASCAATFEVDQNNASSFWKRLFASSY